MSTLFVEKTIEIDAGAAIVWRVLTEPEFTSQWISEFGIRNGRLESEWRLGSPVEWKDESGKILVEGNVTEVELDRRLHFTVIDRHLPQINLTDQDGITYHLKEAGGRTVLSVRQGDFGAVEDGEKWHRMTNDVWNKVLPKIKELAENIN